MRLQEVDGFYTKLFEFYIKRGMDSLVTRSCPRVTVQVWCEEVCESSCLFVCIFIEPWYPNQWYFQKL